MKSFTESTSLRPCIISSYAFPSHSCHRGQLLTQFLCICRLVKEVKTLYLISELHSFQMYSISTWYIMSQGGAGKAEYLDCTPQPWESPWQQGTGCQHSSSCLAGQWSVKLVSTCCCHVHHWGPAWGVCIACSYDKILALASVEGKSC